MKKPIAQGSLILALFHTYTNGKDFKLPANIKMFTDSDTRNYYWCFFDIESETPETEILRYNMPVQDFIGKEAADLVLAWDEHAAKALELLNEKLKKASKP